MEKITDVILLSIFCSFLFPGKAQTMGTEEIVSTTDVSGLAGGVVKLPCDMKVPLEGDKVHLVIWYKEGMISPIYSFDVRQKLITDASHWSDPKLLSGRAYYRVKDEPARLIIENLKDQDGGVYRCRVDFKKSPTRNTKVNLTVILPPERISILNERGQHIPHYALGPFNEGQSVDITCVASGGRPSPRLSWWQENALVDDIYQRTSDRNVTNVLHLEKVTRKDLDQVYTCQASNNNIGAPISASVKIDINLKPLWVRLRGGNRPLSADTPQKVECECVGARPKPIITWWKGTLQLNDTHEQVLNEGNITISTLTFVPTLDDSGKILTCRASTPNLPNSSLEDSLKLIIHHIPIVTLELGSNINGSAMREGVDVYFECNIKSNPWVYRVIWKHNGITLYNNASAGTIVSNQSLVLQSITRARAGIYTCVGSNQEGDGESNPVHLDVKYKPVCRPGQQKMLGVARHEVARVSCEIEANPAEVQFFWRFNNTSETVDIPQAHVVTERLRSTASYMPMTELDFGSLLCWGRNSEGIQSEPCVFHVIPAGKPDGLRNCSITNQTSDIFLVECIEGFDGGLPQEFVMEVFDAHTQAMVVNMTSKVPVFDVHGLESRYGYDISLYASNSKGKSDVAYLKVLSLKDAEKRTAAGQPVVMLNEMTPLLLLAGGVVAAVVFTILISVLIVKMRRRVPAKKPNNDNETESTNKYPAGDDENNPDVIPQSSETEYLDPDEKAFERLNNAPPRILASVPRVLQNAAHQAGYSVPELCKNRDEVTYVDLSLTRQGTYKLVPPQTRCPVEPATEYAEIKGYNHHHHHTLPHHIVSKTPSFSQQSVHSSHSHSSSAHTDDASRISDGTMSVRHPLLETSGTLPRITATRF